MSEPNIIERVQLAALVNNGVHEHRDEPGREEMTAPAFVASASDGSGEWSPMGEWASPAACEQARQHRTRSGWKETSG
jgi:hypothetical protein